MTNEKRPTNADPKSDETKIPDEVARRAMDEVEEPGQTRKPGSTATDPAPPTRPRTASTPPDMSAPIEPQTPAVEGDGDSDIERGGEAADRARSKQQGC